MAFLKLGISGRGIAMSDALVALAGGASATYYNPAGVLTPGNGTTEFLLTHKEWIQDIRTQVLGVSVQLDSRNALGFGINTTTVADIPIYTRPGPAEGSFTSRDFAMSASYARSLSEDLTVGITGKFLFEKIFVDEASGFAVDVGALYQTPLEGVKVGLAVANLGGMSAMRNEKLKLPALVRVGPAFTLKLDDLNSTALAATDMVYVFPEKRVSLNIGSEFLINGSVAVRAGYQPGSTARGLTGGLGVFYGFLSLDYAIASLSSNLGAGHTFSLTITF